MQIYRASAMYSGKEDVLSSFIKNKCFCIGNANRIGKPSLTRYTNLLNKSEFGDIIYIKKKEENHLFMKAIGIIIGKAMEEFSVENDTGKRYCNELGIKVLWIKDYTKNIPIEFENNLILDKWKFKSTLDIEREIEIKNRIINLLNMEKGDI